MSVSPNDAASLIDIKVPDIGDFDEVTVIELLVKPGDKVKQGSVVSPDSEQNKAPAQTARAHAAINTVASTCCTNFGAHLHPALLSASDPEMRER